MSAIQQLLTDHIDIWTAADTAKNQDEVEVLGLLAVFMGLRNCVS